MFDDFNKNNLRVFVDAVKIELQNLLWQMKMNSNTNLKRKIQLSIEFQELAIAYNNVLSFCNKFFTIDRINNVWTIYRCQNSIKYLFEILFVEFDDVKRFAQIHIIDFIQKTLKRRMKSNIDDDVLNEIVLFRLQRLLKKINFYCKDLKTCAKRIKKFDQSEIKIHLKQNDFSRREKNTMNKSTFDEIVIVIIMLDDQNDENSINKNILIQIQNENLIFIFYWQSCYMFLRYSLIFFWNEQNWNTKIAFEKHQNNIKLLIRRNESNVISRHELTFQTSTIFSSKKQFLNQNIDDEREQNQLKKLHDDDIDARVEKEKLEKNHSKRILSFLFANEFWSQMFQICNFFRSIFVFYLKLTRIDQVDVDYINSQKKIQ